jgi:glycerol-3-phosphate dehydrogenase
MRRHGARITEVFAIVKEAPQYAARIVPEVPLIYADLLLCARDEMAVHLVDLLRRRMPLLILTQLDATWLRHLAELLAPEFGWDAQRVADEMNACLI